MQLAMEQLKIGVKEEEVEQIVMLQIHIFIILGEWVGIQQIIELLLLI